MHRIAHMHLFHNRAIRVLRIRRHMGDRFMHMRIEPLDGSRNALHAFLLGHP